MAMDEHGKIAVDIHYKFTMKKMLLDLYISIRIKVRTIGQ